MPSLAREDHIFTEIVLTTAGVSFTIFSKIILILSNRTFTTPFSTGKYFLKIEFGKLWIADELYQIRETLR